VSFYLTSADEREYSGEQLRSVAGVRCRRAPHRADTLSGPCAAGTAGAAAGTAETFTATGATGTAGAGAGPGTWSCVVLCCLLLPALSQKCILLNLCTVVPRYYYGNR